jgi:hypothetical protein
MTGYTGYQDGEPSNDNCNNIHLGLVTSATVRFDTFSTYIKSTSVLSIDYYYNIRMQPWYYEVMDLIIIQMRQTIRFLTGIVYNNGTNIDLTISIQMLELR